MRWLLLLVFLAACDDRPPTNYLHDPKYGCLDPTEEYGCHTPVPTPTPHDP